MWRAALHRLTFRQRQGLAGERVAQAFLRGRGYRIVATNVRFPVGELDIVAWDGPVLCFIEVRMKASDRFGSPLASITATKRQRLLRAVQWYLARARGPEASAEAIRLDVVAITHESGSPPRVELIRRAFDASE